MKTLRYILIFLSGICLFASCEKLVFPKDPANNATTNFQILWETMDEKYVFFDYKNIDWDSAYAVYRPQVYDGMPEQELFDLMAEMLNLLRDGHVNLRSEFDVSYYKGTYLDDPENFSFDLVEKEYLGEDYRRTSGMLNKELGGNVGYIYYGSFNIPISEAALDFLVNLYKEQNIRSLIIDIRNNTGGNIYNGFAFAERLVDTRREVYTTVYKNGPGRDDFSEPFVAYLEPIEEEEKRFSLDKIVLLTNRRTYSAGNFFTALLKAYPQVTVVGDKTGGGGGAPVGWELPNGWYFNFSGSITRLPDGTIIEDGIEPDLYESLTPADEAAGIDPVLEEALRICRE